MRHVVRRVGLAVLVPVFVLSACSSGDQETAPRLAAPPTRTPLPTVDVTQTAVPGAGLEVELVSLRDEVQAFLDASQEASPIDRPVLFEQYVTDARPACVAASYYPGVQPLQLFDLNLVSLDLNTWVQTVQIFPADAMIDSIRETLVEADGRLPFGETLRVCILPVPSDQLPQDQPNGGVGAEVLADNLLIVWCSGGDYCLTRLPIEVLYAYAYAYQIGQTGLTNADVPLLHFMIYNARAEDFVQQVYPATTFPWANALTPEQEATLWGQMHDYLATTYRDYPDYRKIERFLYGRGTEQYPTWGGLYIGSQIVRAYRASHPGVSPVDLMNLPPQTLLDESGYAPG